MLLSDFRTLIRRIYNQHVQNGKSNPHFHTTWIDSIAACMVPDHAAAFSLVIEALFGANWQGSYTDHTTGLTVFEPRVYSISAIALDDMIDDAEEILGIMTFENGGLDSPPASLLWLGGHHSPEC